MLETLANKKLQKNLLLANERSQKIGGKNVFFSRINRWNVLNQLLGQRYIIQKFGLQTYFPNAYWDSLLDKIVYLAGFSPR